MFPDLDFILACPTCVYERVLPSWLWLAALRVLGIALIAFRSLDVVRVVGLFVAFELVYFFLWREMISAFYLGSATAELLAASVMLLFEFGILSLLLLKSASAFEFFKRDIDRKLTWRWALLVPLMMIAIGVVKNAVVPV